MHTKADRYLLGVDVGTTGTKTILFSENGKIVGQAYRTYPTHTPKVSCCEQDPQDWWNAVCATVREVCVDPDVKNRIIAISLSTQGGTMVGLDKRGNVVRPAIVWNDKRCERELEVFRNTHPEIDVYRLCGWKASAAMPLLQCHWMQHYEPELFPKIDLFLSVPDYLAWKMVGVPIVDISNAGICRFVNIQKGSYDDTLLQCAGLNREQLAQVVPSGKPIGVLTKKAAQEMGLSTDVLVVSGAHDQYAVALGAGACKVGDILIGTGTSWVVTSMSDAPDFDSGLAQSVSAVPGLWGSLRSLSSGGVCLEWWRKNLTANVDGTMLPFDLINEEIGRRKAAEDGLFFYPFSGQFTQNKTFRKAAFVGMDMSHDRFHLARAIMEGVAFQVVWMMESFHTRPSQDGIILAGGASRSEPWCKMVANVANLPVRVPKTADLACVGAAILAGVGSGTYASVEDGLRRLTVKYDVVYPDPEYAVVYHKLFSQYKNNARHLGNI